MADITFRSSSSNTSAGANTLSVTAPTGTATGDVVIVIATRNAPAATDGFTDNNGSTPFTNDWEGFNNVDGATLSIFSRRIQGGDPASYSFTFSGDTSATRLSLVALAFITPDPSSIYDVAPSNGTQTFKAPDAATVDAVNVTSTRAGAIHILCCQREATPNPYDNTPSGYTFEINGNTNQTLCSVWWKVIAAAGATGVQTLTASGGMSTSVLVQSFLLLNAPDSGGVDSVPVGSSDTVRPVTVTLSIQENG